MAGVGREGALLAPAYHCVTMLDPAMALNADIQLYPLHADLSPDLEKLDELLGAIPFGDGRWNTKVSDHLMSVVENAAKLEIEFARCLR